MKKINIVFITSIKYRGGGEQWMLSTSIAMSARGHKVILICQPGSDLSKRAEENNVFVKNVFMGGDLNPIASFKLYRILKENNIDVICANMEKEIRIIGLPAKILGIPIFKRRGSDMPYSNNFLYKLSFKWFIIKIIVNSKATMNSILSNNSWIKEKDIKLIYNGLDLSNLKIDKKAAESVKKEFGIPHDSLIIGILAMLTERKGHTYLLNAMPKILEKFPGLRLIISGDGVLFTALQNMAKSSKIKKNVIFTGLRNDVERLINAFDVLVLPSLNEGFGYALAEAMALKTPVVATNISSIPEVVGDCGLLVPIKDSQSLADAIIKILSEKNIAAEFKEKGFQRVHKLFTIDRMCDELEDLFFETKKNDLIFLNSFL
jgi:glycosyltransferase involved in cell wall biosynthesis